MIDATSDTESCQQSCSYLKDISTTRPGRCPADNRATNTGTVAPCVENCRIDLDCRHEAKCCQASCGKMCRKPTHRFEGVPPVPESPHIRERPKGGILEVKWTGASSNFTLPVVYIVESRWTVGAQHSETPFTHWQQISQVIGR
ncbi:hypothetical protein NP493_739g02009 [Ridgeia piscesae]|uniref:WAP domain-containing protein n=1 Tax=Ridgeia piscesae TaxID=27915 RepID=A0AAD9NNW1_RIDPI|nr:hypothetical protein NP493_739g02009 [Ridgeia piscesae]